MLLATLWVTMMEIGHKTAAARASVEDLAEERVEVLAVGVARVRRPAPLGDHIRLFQAVAQAPHGDDRTPLCSSFLRRRCT